MTKSNTGIKPLLVGIVSIVIKFFTFVSLRVLQLPNGMKVMLISDPNISETGPEVLSSADGVDNMAYSSAEEEEESGAEEGEEEEETDEECEEGSDAGSESDTEEDSEGEPESIQSSNGDHRAGGSRRTANLKEGDRMAAASLCVKVGSFSDPPDIPGLAHFLEHMVFMGSKNFPEENAFDDFLKVNKNAEI